MQKKSRLSSIILGVVAMLTIISALSFVKFKNGIAETDSKHQNFETSTPYNELTNILAERTNLDVNNLDGVYRTKFYNIHSNLKKKKFLGAYVGIKDNSVAFSSQFGYVDGNVRNGFRLDSDFLLGHTQEFFNLMLLMKLEQQDKIVLSENLNKYLKKFSIGKKCTVNQLITGEKKYYLNKSDASHFVEAKEGWNYLSEKKTRKGIDAKEYIEAKILTSITNKTYVEVIDSMLIKPFGLSNTRVVQTVNLQANDARSYEYKVQDKVPVQQKINPAEREYLKEYSIRMSLSDIAICMRRVFNTTFLTSQNRRKLVDDDVVMNNPSKNYIIESNQYGQYIRILFNNNSSRMLILATNFPNQDVNITKLANRLYVLTK